ncbi:Uncharacterised protein [Yersinia enterocolitica]|nr:Uncharacterised protein [Yersinia enterocolitica]
MVPSKSTPPIFLAVASLVADAAVPPIGNEASSAAFTAFGVAASVSLVLSVALLNLTIPFWVVEAEGRLLLA